MNESDHHSADIIKPGYLRVSHVLKKYTNFSNIDPEVLNAKAELGTTVHAGITDDCLGEFPMFDDKKQVGYYLSFCKWKEATGATFKLMESRYYCEDLKLTGKIDAVAMIPTHEGLTLIDYKCLASPNHPYFERQAHLYCYLLHVNGIEVGDNFLWIQLDRNGKLPKVRSYTKNKKVLSECIQDVKDWWKAERLLT